LVFCQILCLVWVGFQVVKLFVVEINITGVLEAGGAQGLGLGDGLVIEEVLVKEIGPPFRFFAFQKRQQAFALHLLRDLLAGKLEDCRGNVNVEGEFVSGEATEFLRLPRVVDKERDADGLFVGEPFSGEAVLAEVEAVVSGEDYDSVVGKVEALELGADFSNDDVDAVNEAVVIFDGLLELFWS